MGIIKVVYLAETLTKWGPQTEVRIVQFLWVGRNFDRRAYRPRWTVQFVILSSDGWNFDNRAYRLRRASFNLYFKIVLTKMFTKGHTG